MSRSRLRDLHSRATKTRSLSPSTLELGHFFEHRAPRHAAVTGIATGEPAAAQQSPQSPSVTGTIGTGLDYCASPSNDATEEQSSADTDTTAGPPAKHHGGSRTGCAAHLRRYLRKWRGVPEKKRVDVKLLLFPHWTEIAVAFTGSFLSMGGLAAIHYDWFSNDGITLQMTMGSFGATAVLLYAAPMSPLTQPRNLLGGHILSAIVGVTVRILITEQLCSAHGADCRWLGCALAVSISILIMLFTDTLHPPGGATALIAAMGSPVIDDMGYMFVLVPAASGALLTLLVCLVINNLDPYRSYPQYWF